MYNESRIIVSTGNVLDFILKCTLFNTGQLNPEQFKRAVEPHITQGTLPEDVSPSAYVELYPMVEFPGDRFVHFYVMFR